MSGTLTQLAAKGAQDRNLTVQPEITFFKGVWKHHTNFAIEAIEQDFTSGEAKPGGTATAEIPRSGDLVTDIWVKISLAAIVGPDGFPFASGPGYTTMNHVRTVKVVGGVATVGTVTKNDQFSYGNGNVGPIEPLSSSLNGTGAKFNVAVSSGVFTVTVDTAGTGYEVGEVKIGRAHV